MLLRARAMIPGPWQPANLTGVGIRALHGLVGDRHASPTLRALRGAVVILAFQPLSWAASLLATVYLPRLLGADEFGQFSLAISTAAMAGAVAGLGVPNCLARRLAIDPARASAEGSAALVLVVGASLATAIVLTLGLQAVTFPIRDPFVLFFAFAAMTAFLAQQILIFLLN